MKKMSSPQVKKTMNKFIKEDHCTVKKIEITTCLKIFMRSYRFYKRKRKILKKDLTKIL